MFACPRGDWLLATLGGAENHCSKEHVAIVRGQDADLMCGLGDEVR